MADQRPRVEDLIDDLAVRLGTHDFVAVCTALLGGAPREQYVDELRALTGHDWAPGDAVWRASSWGDFWVRSWGARGLLHVWHDSATAAVVAGLDDEHHRPAEMCLKVVARHEVAGAGDGCARLARHELPRVRCQAMRALAVVGDTEHLPVVTSALDDGHADVRRQAGRALEVLRSRLDL